MNNVKRLARDHARAMTYLHTYIDEVAETAGTLLGTLSGNESSPNSYEAIYSKVDAAMGKLGDAYAELAAAFDNLPE